MLKEKEIEALWFVNLKKACDLNEEQIAWMKTNKVSLTCAWLGMVRTSYENESAPHGWYYGTTIDMPIRPHTAEEGYGWDGRMNLDFDWVKCAQNVHDWIAHAMETGRLDIPTMFKYKDLKESYNITVTTERIEVPKELLVKYGMD